MIKGSLADYRSCDLLHVHTKCLLPSKETAFCHLQMACWPVARLFLTFQEVCLPDSSFHFRFPVIFPRHFFDIIILLESPVSKNLCFFPRSLMVKLSKMRAGYLSLSGCLLLLFGWLCFLPFGNKWRPRDTASGMSYRSALAPATSQFPYESFPRCRIYLAILSVF